MDKRNKSCRKATKSISRDLNAPVSTVGNTVKTITAYGTVADFHTFKIAMKSVQLMDKEPWSTSKQIEADL